MEAPNQPFIISRDCLISIGIQPEDAERASRSLDSLAGKGITDEALVPLWPVLLRALQFSPDPERALRCFSLWFGALPNPAPYLARLLRSPQSIDLFCRVTGCSQYFGDLIVRNPEYFAIIEEPGPNGGQRSAAYFYRHITALIAVCQHGELKRDALRRWKAREMLRIGVRDLAGLSDMPTTTREFSNLADASVQAAHDIALHTLAVAPDCKPPGFAVIGMGKLGGLELNYSSDIDLMFVHTDRIAERVNLQDGREMEAAAYVTKLSEIIISVLADETSNGHVFRVDMRLRPEGRFGSITRSLSSFRAYYESWAENWEFQALLKARFIAGDRSLGESFMALVEPYAYREFPSARFMEEVRQNKRRIEAKCELEGQTETNVKTGFGGIRDVEFIVQSLQLRYGGRYKRLRTPNTLTAIRRLHRAHLLTNQDAHQLSKAYIFLRNLEHRLQLLQGFQVQNLPTISQYVDRTRVALRMGYADLEQFEDQLKTHREQIHEALERLFYAETAATDSVHSSPTVEGDWAVLPSLLDNLSAPAARERLTELLLSHGFRDIPSALHALQLPMTGNEFGEMPPDTPEEFKRIAPALMERAARSASPDAALRGLESIALAVPNRAQIYAAFEDSPDVLDRLVRLAAGSPPLLHRLATHLEWLEAVLSPEDGADLTIADITVADSDQTDNPSPYYDRVVAEMRQRRARSAASEASIEKHIDAISTVFQREALLIGAHEIWEDTDSSIAMRGLTDLAEATLQVLLEMCSEHAIAASKDPDQAAQALSTVAVIGLGKLGGSELGYASDWDLLVVYQASPRTPHAHSSSDRARVIEDLVSRLTDAGQKLITRGANIEIDLRLRPWGRSGSLALSTRAYAEYYRSSAETWERQAALKARYVAGSLRTGARLMRILRAVSYGHGLSAAEESDVLAMKSRIELERLSPADRYTDVKLGYGGLIDIEWIAQKLQMKHAARHPSIRRSNTILALSALAAIGLLDNSEADVLISAYNLLVRVRNAMWLQSGRSQDTLPSDLTLLHTLAKELGYSGLDARSAETIMVEDIAGHMRETRAIFERRFRAG